MNSEKICLIEGCDNLSYCKEMCRSHYNKQYKSTRLLDTSFYNKKYKNANKIRTKIYNKKYAETDRGRFNKAKTKAKSRNLSFTLSFDLFLSLSGNPCYYCNDELCKVDNYQGAHLDRIDNLKGYEEGNVLSCGLLCNQIRMDNLSVDETKDAVEGILLGRKKRLLLQ